MGEGAPERIWLAQRGGTNREWRKVPYGKAKAPWTR